MRCKVCGQEGAQAVTITETYGKGRNLIMVENVPMISCHHCGESYFTAKTLHALEAIRQQAQSFGERPVKVADFTHVAPAA